MPSKEKSRARLFFDHNLVTRHIGDDGIVVPVFNANGPMIGRQSPDDIEAFIDIVFKQVKAAGKDKTLLFDLSEERKMIEFENLCRIDYRKSLIGDSVIGPVNGGSLAWSYFDHINDIRCGTMLTPTEIFEDDDKLRRAIKKVIARKLSFNPGYIRASIAYFSGTQRVSNFRVAAAGCVYEYFGGDGVVWDMSCGFGGRLIGALSSKRIVHYIGTDPSTPTFDGLERIKKDFEKKSGKLVTLHKMGSEDFTPTPNSLDLCFTSPPYFNTEKYTEEDSQSYVKFPTQNAWLTGFMFQTMTNCYHGLKDGRYMIINIANVKSYPTVNDDIIALAKSIGFSHVYTLKYVMSNLIKGGRNKFEPIFVFRKGDGLSGEAWLQSVVTGAFGVRRRIIG